MENVHSHIVVFYTINEICRSETDLLSLHIVAEQHNLSLKEGTLEERNFIQFRELRYVLI
jgi:hypothetical protein